MDDSTSECLWKSGIKRFTLVHFQNPTFAQPDFPCIMKSELLHQISSCYLHGIFLESVPLYRSGFLRTLLLEINWFQQCEQTALDIVSPEELAVAAHVREKSCCPGLRGQAWCCSWLLHGAASLWVLTRAPRPNWLLPGSCHGCSEPLGAALGPSVGAVSLWLLPWVLPWVQ